MFLTMIGDLALFWLYVTLIYSFFILHYKVFHKCSVVVTVLEDSTEANNSWWIEDGYQALDRKGPNVKLKKVVEDRKSSRCCRSECHIAYSDCLNVAKEKVNQSNNEWNVICYHTDLHCDHSPDNVKFPDDYLTVCGTPPQHSAC